MPGHGAWPRGILPPKSVPRHRLRDLLGELECPRLAEALSAPLLAAEDWSVDLCTPPGSNIPGPLPPALSGRSSAIVNRSGAIVHVLWRRRDSQRWSPIYPPARLPAAVLEKGVRQERRLAAKGR